MHQVQLTDQVYEYAKRRASLAGFKSVDDFIEDVLLADESGSEENHDDRFTPKVIAHLDQILAEVRAGANAFTEEEADEYLRTRSEAWRKSHASYSFSSLSMRKKTLATFGNGTLNITAKVKQLRT